MASKNISIDIEAYNRLKKSKKGDESFSQVIKRLVPKPFDYMKWLDDLAANPASDQFIKAVEQVIADRRVPHNLGERNAMLGYNRSNRSASTEKKIRATKSRSRSASVSAGR